MHELICWWPDRLDNTEEIPLLKRIHRNSNPFSEMKWNEMKLENIKSMTRLLNRSNCRYILQNFLNLYRSSSVYIKSFNKLKVEQTLLRISRLLNIGSLYGISIILISNLEDTINSTMDDFFILLRIQCCGSHETKDRWHHQFHFLSGNESISILIIQTEGPRKFFFQCTMD